MCMYLKKKKKKKTEKKFTTLQKQIIMTYLLTSDLHKL